MAEEQKSWKIGKMGRVSGISKQEGKPDRAYDFLGGFLRARQTRDRLVDMVKGKSPDVVAETVNGKKRHKVPINIYPIAEKYIDRSADNPRTHNINIGNLNFQSHEPEDHDVKVSDITKMKF